MARLIRVSQLPKRGRYSLMKTGPRATNAKIVTPHPKVLSGRPYEKVISSAVYGLEPFSL